MKYLISLFFLFVASCATPLKQDTQKYFVDMVVFFNTNQSRITIEQFEKQLEFADKTFAQANVELNLIKINYVETSKNQSSFVGVSPSKKPNNNRNPYRQMESHRDRVPEKTISIVKDLVNESAKKDRILVLVGFDMEYQFYEKRKGKWAFDKTPISGFSFPPYGLQDRIPDDLRGLIVVSKFKNPSILAHELGHKLINVSHEGWQVCPQFAGTKVPGLMGYKQELEIGQGEAGRFHQERLRRSPFLYRIKSGKRLPNPDFKAGGVYDDPIYGKFALKQPCPLRVGMTGDYAPFSFGKPGKYKGIDVEIAKFLALHLQQKLQLVPTSWPTLSRDLSQDKFDLAISGITVTKKRQKEGLFSKGYIKIGKMGIARCADKEKYSSLQKANQPHVRVAINPGGTNEKFARKNLKKAQLVLFQNNSEIFANIIAGKADVMFTDSPEVFYQAKMSKGKLCPTIPKPLTNEEIAIFMAKNPKLKKTVDQWLVDLEKSGKKAELFSEYGL